MLAATIAKIEIEQRGPLPTRFAVIAMGRYGGHEVGFGSDADVIFVHDPLPGLDADGDRRASEAAQAVGTELRRLLQIPAPDPPLLVDADLRPEGRQGPLVRSLAACRAYYERRAAPWEWQALLRAEFAAGDASLGAEFIAVADRHRYPAGGLSEQAVREIRRIKARMESERIPRGADRALHVKLGPGGLSDVEWTVQLLQLGHAHAVAGLRTTRTLEALDAAVAAGLIEAEDAAALRAAWEFAARIRNAIMLVRAAWRHAARQARRAHGCGPPARVQALYPRQRHGRLERHPRPGAGAGAGLPADRAARSRGNGPAVLRLVLMTTRGRSRGARGGRRLSGSPASRLRRPATMRAS